MKLGVVTTSYPRWSGDPAGSFVAAHVTALRALGHTVDVVAAGDPDVPSDVPSDEPHVTRLPGALFYRGGAPDLLERHPVRTFASAVAFSARFAAVVAARASAWDSIVAHWWVPSALAALPVRAPLLAIAHGGDVHTLRRLHLLAPALHALRARGATLAFVSEELRMIACRAAPSLARWLADAIVQPMGIDVARFGAIGRAPTDPPTIVVAARLVPLKGVDVAIAALAHLRTPVRLVIAGDGPERALLAARALRVGRTELVGAVDTATRDQLLRRASVVVVPSRIIPSGRTEGTPMIALEALAAGVPVVASRVGGLRALAPAAHLVAPDDPRQLATAIDTILAAPPSGATLQRAIAHLDWEAVAPRLVRNP